MVGSTDQRLIVADLLDNEYSCEYCRDQGWVYTESQPCPECQDGPTPELEVRIITAEEFEPIGKELEAAEDKFHKERIH